MDCARLREDISKLEEARAKLETQFSSASDEENFSTIKQARNEADIVESEVLSGYLPYFIEKNEEFFEGYEFGEAIPGFEGHDINGMYKLNGDDYLVASEDGSAKVVTMQDDGSFAFEKGFSFAGGNKFNISIENVVDYPGFGLISVWGGGIYPISQTENEDYVLEEDHVLLHDFSTVGEETQVVGDRIYNCYDYRDLIRVIGNNENLREGMLYHFDDIDISPKEKKDDDDVLKFAAITDDCLLVIRERQIYAVNRQEDGKFVYDPEPVWDIADYEWASKYTMIRNPVVVNEREILVDTGTDGVKCLVRQDDGSFETRNVKGLEDFLKGRSRLSAKQLQDGVLLVTRYAEKSNIEDTLVLHRQDNGEYAVSEELSGFDGAALSVIGVPGNRVLVGGKDGVLRVLDCKAGQTVDRLKEHLADIAAKGE